MRDTLISCLSHAPCWGPGQQPGLVPLLGIKQRTFQLASQHTTHWATPARANWAQFKKHQAAKQSMVLAEVLFSIHWCGMRQLCPVTPTDWQRFDQVICRYYDIAHVIYIIHTFLHCIVGGWKKGRNFSTHVDFFQLLSHKEPFSVNIFCGNHYLILNHCVCRDNGVSQTPSDVRATMTQQYSHNLEQGPACTELSSVI